MATEDLGYNVNPGARTGSSPYGYIPNPIDIPPSTYEQVGSVYPGLANQASQISANIGHEAAGELSPETIAALQQNAAQFGVTSGMPLSQLQGHTGLLSVAQNVQATQRQAEQDYLAALQGIGGTMTPQSLAADIASRNATLAAAPDPTAAAQQQQQNWMNAFHGSAGGAPVTTGAPNPAGGTGNLHVGGTGPTGMPTSQVGGTGVPASYVLGGTGPFNTYDPSGGLGRWQAAGGLGTSSWYSPDQTNQYSGNQFPGMDEWAQSGQGTNAPGDLTPEEEASYYNWE